MSDPFAQFATWFAEAQASEPNDPNAMTLATVDADGLPDARMVLLKGLEPRGFTFYTNSESAKGLELGSNMKAALICALAPKPKLLLMDEPFTGVDVAAKDDLVRAILLAAGEAGSTIVISSHDIAELEPMCDWLGFLDQGELKVSRAIEELRDYGVGAQILRELGVTRMKLLGSPRRMPSMMGYGLEVTGFIAADASQGTD